MFPFPAVPDATRALGTFEVSGDTPLLDLDDARALLERGLRPTQVIQRNRPVTQAWALRIYQERDRAGSPLWAGVRWWSYHRPSWPIYGLWGVVPVCVGVEALHLDHPAVRDAARSLSKPLP